MKKYLVTKKSISQGGAECESIQDHIQGKKTSQEGHVVICLLLFIKWHVSYIFTVYVLNNTDTFNTFFRAVQEIQDPTVDSQLTGLVIPEEIMLLEHCDTGWVSIHTRLCLENHVVLGTKPSLSSFARHAPKLLYWHLALEKLINTKVGEKLLPWP